jgi:hypothetical protein
MDYRILFNTGSSTVYRSGQLKVTADPVTTSGLTWTDDYSDNNPSGASYSFNFNVANVGIAGIDIQYSISGAISAAYPTLTYSITYFN